MALELIRTDKLCPDIRDCPNINIDRDRGVWVVVGYRTALASTVELPRDLAPEWDTNPDARTATGRLLIAGQPVGDPAVLDELGMDPNEAAVELPVESRPALGVPA